MSGMSRSDQYGAPMGQGGPVPGEGSLPLRRILFLDDDPERASTFLAEVPQAVWVSTVEECLRRLEEDWHEVHLDHDLGGETFVDCGREDCGMEVVRWLCLEPHPHLAATQFYVHSHNAGAADLMVGQLRVAGFQVVGRPFGRFPAHEPYVGPKFVVDEGRERGISAWLRELRRYVFGTSRPFG